MYVRYVNLNKVKRKKKKKKKKKKYGIKKKKKKKKKVSRVFLLFKFLLHVIC